MLHHYHQKTIFDQRSLYNEEMMTSTLIFYNIDNVFSYIIQLMTFNEVDTRIY